MINEKADSTVSEVQKSQAVRLADVFLIAPYLLYVSSKRELSELDKNLLFGLGVATLFYNAINYIQNKNKKDE
jgi:hypothetical protein